MTRREGAFFVKTAPSPLVLSSSPKKLSSGRAPVPVVGWRRFEMGHAIRPGRKEGEGWRVKRAGIFLSLLLSRLLPGRWNTSGSMGRGLPAMKRRIRRGSSLISLAAGTPQGGTLFVRRNVLCGCREVKACLGIPAAMPEGLVGLPGGCCLVVGPEWRGEAGRSETRAGILRLGNALAGKADAVQGGRYGVLRSLLGMSGGWDSPCGALPAQLVSGRRWPAGRKKALHAEGFVIPDGRTGFRDCPREGVRLCLPLGGHAVPSEKMAGKGGAWERGSSCERSPFRRCSFMAGFRLGPKRQPSPLPCGRRCGGRRR